MRRKILWLSDRCNNNCWMCYMKKSAVDIDASICDIDKGDEVYITGGEPLLCQDLPEILRKVTERRPKKIHLITNGRAFVNRRFIDIIAPFRNTISVMVKFFGDNISNDDITRVENSYRQASTGMKNLLDAGFSIELLIPVCEQNFTIIERMIEQTFDIRTKRIFLCNNSDVANQTSTYVRFSEIRPYLKRCLDRWNNTFMYDFPYCLIPEYQDRASFLFRENTDKDISTSCDDCYYEDSCPKISDEYVDLFDAEEIDEFNLPEEIIIDMGLFRDNIRSKNQDRCSGHQVKMTFSEDSIESTTQKIPSEIQKIRLLDPEAEDIKDDSIIKIVDILTRYGKEIWLETGLKDMSDIKLETFSEHLEGIIVNLDEIDDDVFSNIKKLNSMGMESLHIRTAITEYSIHHLEDLLSKVNDLQISSWEFFIPADVIGDDDNISDKNVDVFIKKLRIFNKTFNKDFRITRPISFCKVANKTLLSELISRSPLNNRKNQMAINSDGEIISSIDSSTIIGNLSCDRILDVWNSDMIKALRKMEFVKDSCKECSYFNICQGKIKTKTVNEAILRPEVKDR